MKRTAAEIDQEEVDIIWENNLAAENEYGPIEDVVSL